MSVLLAVVLMLAAVPRPLVTLESAAEDLGDAAQHGHWRSARQLLARAQDALGQLDGRSDAQVLASAREDAAAVSVALRAKDRWGAAYAANRLSGEVVRLYAPLDPSPPTDVMSLDVLLREVELDGLTGKAGEADRPLRRAEAIWSGLRARPPVSGSHAESRFGAELAAARTAVNGGDARAVGSSAGRALEGVDLLERLWSVRRAPGR